MDGKHKIVQSGMVDLNDDHKNDIHSLLKQLTELLNKMVRYGVYATFIATLSTFSGDSFPFKNFHFAFFSCLWQPNQINDSLSEENTDPAIHPMLCVSQWVDGSAKYGFGYVLSDGSVGVMFNDTTKIIVLANEKWVVHRNIFSSLPPTLVISPHIDLNSNPNFICLILYSKVLYIDRNGNEQNMTEQEYPEELRAKMKLLSYFKNYMVEHLVKAGGDTVHGAGDALPHSPHLHTWFRASCAIVTLLTNGSVQVIDCHTFRCIWRKCLKWFWCFFS